MKVITMIEAIFRKIFNPKKTNKMKIATTGIQLDGGIFIAVSEENITLTVETDGKEKVADLPAETVVGMIKAYVSMH